MQDLDSNPEPTAWPVELTQGAATATPVQQLIPVAVAGGPVIGGFPPVLGTAHGRPQNAPMLRHSIGQPGSSLPIPEEAEHHQAHRLQLHLQQEPRTWGFRVQDLESET